MVFSRPRSGAGRSWTGRFLSYFAGEALASKPTLLSDIHRMRYDKRGRVHSRLDAALHDFVRLAPERFDELALCDPCFAAACVADSPAVDRPTARAKCIEILALMLASRDTIRRQAAVRALASLGSEAVPQLETALERQEPYIRRRLLHAIGRISTSAATCLLLRKLQDGDKWVRREAGDIILSFDSERRAHTIAFIDRFREDPVGEAEQDLLRDLASLDTDFHRHVAAILGEELPPDLPANVEDVVADTAISAADIDITDEDGWAGEELLRQLVASEHDASVGARCRRWLHRAPSDHRSWGLIWTNLWDRNADDELRTLGRHWLERAAPAAGAWSHVWTRLVDTPRADEELTERGREWLDAQYPAGIGWPHVWRALFRLRADSAMRAIGMQWLRSGSDAQSQDWAVVWIPLYRAMEADPDGAGQLLDVGFSLLRETPFDQVAWGFVLPELCRSPHRADAMDMGQRWVEGAPPKSACWGYVFPAVWRNGERPYRLRSIAHAWLTQTPHSHPSWWFVWEALAKTSRYDRQLLAMGIDYLDDMPAEDQGWARVWEVLWTLEFERAQLEPRARGWLATTGAPIDELGWPRVFSRLFTETALDETMLSRALEFLPRPWRHLWPRVWLASWNGLSHLPAPVSESAMRTLAMLARDWLHAPSEHGAGYGLVWEQLWDRGRDDVLRRLALEFAKQQPDDPTIRPMWAQLTSSLAGDRELRDAGMRLLRSTASGEQKHWPAIWLDVWGTGASAELRVLGRRWLADQRGHDPRWPAVWRQIWNDEGRSDALIDIAVAGLSRQVDPELPRKHRANTVWRDIWPVLWSAGVRRDDFIAATLSWVAPTSRLPEGIRREIARPLRAEGLLPAELRTAIDGVASRPAISLEQCRQVAQWPAGAPGFLTAWVQCWKCEEARPELVPCALEWLRLNGYQRGFAPTWRDVYDFTGPSEPLLAIGRKWLSSGSPDRTGWGFVFDGVMRSGPSDPQLVQLGGRWLASQFFVRQTWPFVWATLWDLELSDRDRLIRTADAWLAQPDRRFRYSLVWRRLWDADHSPAKLRELAETYLETAEDSEDREAIEQRLADVPPG